MDVALVRLKGPLDIDNAWPRFSEPLGLAYLASSLLGAGFSVEILDGLGNWWDSHQVLDEIKKYEPRLIGLTITYQSYFYQHIELLRELRSLSFAPYVCIGGHFPTIEHQSILREFVEIDFVVRGEGEQTLVELMQLLDSPSEWHRVAGLTFRRSSKIMVNGNRATIQPLEALHHPVRWSVPLFKAHGVSAASVISSRGCYGQCRFCSVKAVNRAVANQSWRPRPPTDVIDEVQQLYQGHSIRYFQFKDENLIGPGQYGRDHALGLAREIIDRGLDLRYTFSCRPSDVERDLFSQLHESGLVKVFLGVESWNPKSLDGFAKNTTPAHNLAAIEILESLGLRTLIGFIMFGPDSTLQEIKRNVDYFRRLQGFNFYAESLWRRLEVFAGSDLEAEDGRYLESPAFRKGQAFFAPFVDHRVHRLYHHILRSLSSWINFYAHCLYEVELRHESAGRSPVHPQSLLEISNTIVLLTLDLLDDCLAIYRGWNQGDPPPGNQERALIKKHIRAFQESSYSILKLVAADGILQ